MSIELTRSGRMAVGAVVACASLLAVAAPASASTLRIETNGELGSIDPAINYASQGWQLEYATCSKLLNSADAAGAAGAQLVPDAAVAMPTVSADGRTYTFTVRDGLRFSPPSGELVDAQTFKHALERILSPAVGSPGAVYYQDISSMVADGQALTITLNAPAPDFLDRIALPFACAVPHDTPLAPVGAPLASAGPYYFASYSPGGTAVLLRNPSYTGSRPSGFDEIDSKDDVAPATVEADVLAGRADYTNGGFDLRDAASLYAQYGPGSPHQQFFVNAQNALVYAGLNTARPLLSSLRARKAVNMAIDRPAMVRAAGAFSGSPTDQILPPGLTSFRDAHIYPLGHPDFHAARRLLGSTTGTASIYTCDLQLCLRWARVVRRDLARIGLGGEIHAFPFPELLQRLNTPGEPYDIALNGWIADYADAFSFINVLLGPGNFEHFDDPMFQARIAAAALLSGPARDAAYGDLDVDLMRHAAPMVPLFNPTAEELVSANVANVLYGVYYTDLAALRPA